MSAIAGFWNGGGAPARESDLGAMLEPLKRRGPDGISRHVSGSLALGHAHLATTPQAVGEGWPISHPDSGCMIVADARLDYRADLMEKLDLSAPENGASDGELILRAYLRWGRACAERLEGDFAFIIHDPRDQCLFGARDRVGMRRLAYAFTPARMFAFATDPLAIAAHPAIPGDLNEAVIGDVLDGQEAFDRTSTLFKAVHRLPPAHAMIVDADGPRHWQYWDLGEAEPLNLPSDAAYADALRDALGQSVQTRLRTAGRAGAMLSGGMDSGSICALAADALKREGKDPLITISATTHDPDCVESSMIALAQGLDNIDARSVHLEDADSYHTALAQQLQSLDDPYDGHMSAIRAVYTAAHRAGLKMLLDGACGDTTLGAQDVPLWHLRHGRLRTAWREIAQERWVYRMDDPVWPAMRRSTLTAMLPAKITHMRKALAHSMRAKEAGSASLIDPDFAQHIAMPDRRVAYQRMIGAHLRNPLGQRAGNMLHPFVAAARERYDRVAGACAIEPRDPFADTRLMAVLMRFPVDQFRADGWHKIVLRRAMKGWLPEDLIWRRGKEHLGYRFSEMFQFAGAQEAADRLDDLKPYVQASTLKAAKTRLKDGSGQDDDARLYHLALWLKRIKMPSGEGVTP